jgi:lipopolysaccharide transport system ATP-binding protein
VERFSSDALSAGLPMSSKDLAISVRGLSKCYAISHNATRHSTLAEELLHRIRRPLQRSSKETFWALRDLSFDIRQGEVVGIIGRNGAGKSTLLKILSQITEPTRGEVDLYGRVGSLLEVGTGFHPELTGRENIYLNGAILGMRKREIDCAFDAIVDFAGVEQFLDTPVKRYSTGMYVRLAFAVAAHLNAEILLVDEVLAVGDAEFQKKCLGKMRDVAHSGRTVLFVSHNMAAVATLCTKGIYLQDGQLKLQGTPRETIAGYLDGVANNDFRPPSGPLKRLMVFQEGSTIILNAWWTMDRAVTLPNLGFVIYDALGMPVCGANAVVCGVERLKTPASSGKIDLRVREPKLLDGQYSLSIWFGDGQDDHAHFPSCILFDVHGMAGPRQQNPATVGPVFPACDWRFDPADLHDTAVFAFNENAEADENIPAPV